MIFNSHSNLAGTHAFLSASNHHWLNYDDSKLVHRFLTAMAAKRGTELHAFAHEAIRLGIRLPDDSMTLNLYVNDAIEYRMSAEQTLFYSINCYGTADAISFRDGILRIHDLKTGVVTTSERQLEVYAALFCLEYGLEHGFTPFDIEIELRIYQNNEVRVYKPLPDAVHRIMEKIVVFDKRLEALKQEVMA